jgi:hypothetical protein
MKLRRKLHQETCRRPKKNCSHGKSDRELHTYADVVRDYRDHYQENSCEEHGFYATQNSLQRVVELAGLAKTVDEKRHPHQRRLSADALRRGQSKLVRCKFNACQSFDELIKMVKDAIGDVDGIGALMVYDTACRIGAFLRLEPERIYLHAGTRNGANAIGLGHGHDFLELDELPIEFHSLRAAEIEDCLCIYKDELGPIKAR